MTARRPLLEVGALAIRFRGERGAVIAVDDVSFSIGPGETLALVGESGSGKSLSALSILGLVPPSAEVAAGRGIRWRGRRIDGHVGWLSRLRGRRIGIVFQEPAGCLSPLMAVGDQIAEAVRRRRDIARGAVRRRRDIARGAVRLRVASLLAEVGLDPACAGRRPHELSGGQQQRVMIAIALAGDPALMIADEPTTALDVTIQAQIIALLQDLKRRRGMGLLFISHDLALVASIADRVAVMRQGRIVEQGAAALIFARPRHPYTRALLAARPHHETMAARLPVLEDLLAGRAPSPPLAKPAIGSTVLSIDQLIVDYPKRGWLGRPFRAVDDVSIQVAAGETLGLVGESGSGKSTVAKAIVGLVRPTSGSLILFGETMAADRAPGHPRCQIVFQDSNGSLNPRLTIARILGEPLDLRGLHRGPARRDRLEALLAEVQLSASLLERYPHELSGGQRQRINISRALALDPEILICDEIVSALDVTVQAQVLNLLKDIQAVRHLALLFISHDLAVVRFMADRIVVMKDGRIVEAGAAADVLDRPQHAYTRLLMGAIPRPPANAA